MLRSPVAVAVVIGAVVISHVSALGLGTLIWHDLLGRDLHWVVPSIAFIALVAVGADYNLLLTMLSSGVISIEQVGTTIAAGLIIDTRVVRAFVVPRDPCSDREAASRSRVFAPPFGCFPGVDPVTP